MQDLTPNMQKIFRENLPPLIPKLDNLYFFNEVNFTPETTTASKKGILNKSFKPIYIYEHFLKQKSRRPTYDLYACFQPFNEAIKAVMPFLKELQKEVKKDDVILNLWDRSGWLTNLLAGMFPEQHIVTTWEGNKDVLGYQGFHYWMKENKNITILFCDLNKPIPLADKSIKFSIGLDVFHRFDQVHMLEELKRVVNIDGAILFPHVHLSNSEPIPFFERGCKQIHGNEYKSAFDHFNKNDNWEGYIFSEPQLFISNDITNDIPIPIESDYNTPDYNALIAILPQHWIHKKIKGYSLKDIPEISNARVLINSLVNISLQHQKVSIDLCSFDGQMKAFLERHPIYLKRIENLDGYLLSEMATKVIFLAKNGHTIKEISSCIDYEEKEVIKELLKLEKEGLIQVLPVSETCIRLQHYIMTQEFIVPEKLQTIKHLWQETVKAFSKNTAIISLQDDSDFTYDDANEIVGVIVTTLLNSGLKKGDKIMICNGPHTEAILLFWACMQLGIIVIPITEHLTDETFNVIIDKTQSKFLFTNQLFYSEKESILKNQKVILFDTNDNEPAFDLLYFSDWLTDDETINCNNITIESTDSAVILFTSGSTGIPKGVELTHGNLYRSGRLITETFHWNEKDRFFALGGLEAMSGLRNSTIAALHVGASVVIPSENTLTNLFAITEAISKSQSSILGSNPAFLRQTIKYKDKIRGQLDSIKTLICTGNKLSNTLREEFNHAYNLSIYNYYGLSETTGICISQSPLDDTLTTNTIGFPKDCIAQIVDDENNIIPSGEKGELRIFSKNLMKGYYKDKDQTKNVIKDGWFYTQDIARYTENGSIELLGRKRNIIKTTSEELVYLDVIQQYISELDFIDDVSLCPYIENDIEKIGAFFTIKDSLEENKDSIKNKLNRLLTEQFGAKKTPNKLIILTQLPYNNNGKLLKSKLLNELI